jgi:hypothetical protein
VWLGGTNISRDAWLTWGPSAREKSTNLCADEGQRLPTIPHLLPSNNEMEGGNDAAFVGR